MTQPTAFELTCSAAVSSFRAALLLADAAPHPDAAREQLWAQLERVCDKAMGWRLGRLASKLPVPRNG
jgi:hypothetical protein